MSEDILVECSACGDYLEITNLKPVTYHDIQTGTTLVVKPCTCGAEIRCLRTAIQSALTEFPVNAKLPVRVIEILADALKGGEAKNEN